MGSIVFAASISLTIGLVFSSAVFAAGPHEVEGPLTVYVVDYFDQHRAETKYFIDEQATHRRIELHFEQEPKEGLSTGMVIRSNGRLNGASLESAEAIKIISYGRHSGRLSGKSLSSSLSASPGMNLPDITPASGPQTTLVFNLVSSAGAAIPKFSNDEIENMMFGPSRRSVNSYYLQNSYNSVTFAGKVVGPLAVTEIPVCNVQGWAVQADQLAIAQGIDITAYTHHVYMLPAEMMSICEFAGSSTFGGSPSLSWISIGYFSPNEPNINMAAAHELGHSLGMQHAQAIQADGVTLDEYGDNSCIMGNRAYDYVNLNVPHLIQEGWISRENILQVSTDGIYTVYYAETQSSASNPQALQIVIPGTAGNMYVSYRQLPSDNNDVNLQPAFTGGASIHYWNGSNSKTQLANNSSALSDRQSYNSTDGQVSIRQIAHTNSSVTVEVITSSSLPPIASPMTIANSASGATTVAPGSLASIYGLSIGGAPTVQASTTPLLTILGGIQVFVNNVASPLLYVSPTQINFQVPDSIAAGNAPIDVIFNGQTVAYQPQLTIAPRAVGMFTVPNAEKDATPYLNALVTYYNDGQASPVYHTVSGNPNLAGQFQLNAISVDPAMGTAVLSIYATGVNAKGGVSAVLFNNISAVPAYSGPQGTYPGLDQINVFIPTGLSGVVTVKIKESDQTVLMQFGN